MPYIGLWHSDFLVLIGPSPFLLNPVIHGWLVDIDNWFARQNYIGQQYSERLSFIGKSNRISDACLVASLAAEVPNAFILVELLQGAPRDRKTEVALDDFDPVINGKSRPHLEGWLCHQELLHPLREYIILVLLVYHHTLWLTLSLKSA